MSYQWHAKITIALSNFGLTQNTIDHSLFIQNDDVSFTSLLIYVDDIIITSNSLYMINCIKKYLHNQFHTKDVGELKFSLEIKVARSQCGLVLNQLKYCLEIIFEYGLIVCKPVNTPINPCVRLTEDEYIIIDPTGF